MRAWDERRFPSPDAGCSCGPCGSCGGSSDCDMSRRTLVALVARREALPFGWYGRAWRWRGTVALEPWEEGTTAARAVAALEPGPGQSWRGA